MDNKRKEPRTLVSFPVACGLLPQRNYFYTVCKDLSSGGIRLISDDFMPRGNFLRINLNLIDRVIDLRAKVVWCNKQRYADRYYVGLEFTEVNKTNKTYLKGFLTSSQSNTNSYE